MNEFVLKVHVKKLNIQTFKVESKPSRSGKGQDAICFVGISMCEAVPSTYP